MIRLICLAVALFAASASGQNRQPDVIFVPTPQEVVEDMLRLVDVKKGDVLYDLGSGDGRIPVTAAKKYGIRAVGIDIGTRIVSHQFDMGDWAPDKKLESNGRTVYFWTIPAPARRR